MSKIQFDFAVKRLYLNSFSNLGAPADFVVSIESDWFGFTAKPRPKQE
jgi:hypothetical protein